MAYNPGIEQDDEQQNQQGEQGGTNQLSGGSGIITGQAGEAGGNKQKGSGFVNIGQYLGANQQDLAGQTDAVVNKVSDNYAKAGSGVESAKNQFNTAADQNRVGIGDLNTTDDDKQFVSDFLRNDNAFDDGEQAQFATWKGQQYKGPQGLDESAWSGSQRQAEDLSSNLSDASGYFPAMQQIFGDGKSNYSQGQQRLDASLLAADTTARQRIDQTSASESQRVQEQVRQAQQAASEKAKRYQQEAAAGRDAANAALMEYMPEYMQGLTSQVAGTNAQRRAEYEAARQGGGQRLTGMAANTNAHTVEQGILGVNDRGQYEVGDTGWSHPDQLSYSYVDPTRANYTTYGGDVGLGSVGNENIAKLEALFAMSGDDALRQQMESDAASRIGMDAGSLYLDNSSLPSYSFDQTTYNTDRQNAINAAIQAAIAEDARKEEDYYANLERMSRAIRNPQNEPVFTPGQLQI